MVMILKTKIMRPAIAMLELIFAIVIMAIILMSAPMLINTAAKSGFIAIQQEAINEAASQVNMIMGHHWDENTANDLFIDPILQVSASGDSELNENNSSGRRLGTPDESYRSFIRSDGQTLTASTLTKDANDSDDIDDYAGDTYLQEIQASLADNVETTTIRIDSVVSYIDDSPSGGTFAANNIIFNPNLTTVGTTSSASSTNIKRISVSLISTSGLDELDKEITLHAFSSNIGAYHLEERDF